MPLTSTGPRSPYSKRPARGCGDDDRVRLGQGLQPGGEVRRLADDRLLLRRTLADQIADDHQPGGDADPRFECGGFDIEASDSVDDVQPRPDRPLGIVLMRARVAEIDENAVAHVLGDEAIEHGDDLGDRAVISADQLAQILRVMTGRERRRPDKITEHHRQLSAFGVNRRRGGGRGYRARR